MWALSRIPPLLGLALLVAACATTKSTLPALPPDIDPNDPTSATQLMRQGQIMIADGRVEEGIARYRMALQLQPDNPTIHNLLGVAELQRGQAKQALEHLNKALSLAPAYSDARNNRGAAYARLGQLAMAEADYLVVLGDTTHANRAGVYFNLGALYLEKGNLPAAEENLKKAVSSAGPIEAAFVLGKVEEKLEKIELAEGNYRSALGRAPERVDVALALASLLERTGRGSEANTLYKRIVSLAPGSAEAEQARRKLGI